MHSSPIRVFIATDQNLIQQGLTAILKQQEQIQVIGHTSKLTEVLPHFRQHRPNVMLIDLTMEGQDTLETVKTITKEFPRMGILIVTTYDGSEDIHRALRAGARGYVLTDVSDAELMEAIRLVNVGRNYISSQIASRLAQRMNRSTLTQREMEVMQLIVRGKSNKEIAGDLNVSEETVKYHVKSILAKLGVGDRTQAATAALLRGIVRPVEP